MGVTYSKAGLYVTTTSWRTQCLVGYSSSILSDPGLLRSRESDLCVTSV